MVVVDMDITLTALYKMLPSLFQSNDAAHDFSHTLRVYHNAMIIGEQEQGDLSIVLPAALLHDLVVYPKNHPKSLDSSKESAEKAKQILEQLHYPREKIQ